MLEEDDVLGVTMPDSTALATLAGVVGGSVGLIPFDGAGVSSFSKLEVPGVPDCPSGCSCSFVESRGAVEASEAALVSTMGVGAG